MIGRRDEAEQLFDRLIALKNDLGLFSEEYDQANKRLIGNMPQAFTHLTLIAGAKAPRATGAGPMSATQEALIPTGAQFEIAHGDQSRCGDGGRRDAPGLRGRRGTRDRRVRGRRAVVGRPRTGARALAEPARGRPVFLRAASTAPPRWTSRSTGTRSTGSCGGCPGRSTIAPMTPCAALRAASAARVPVAPGPRGAVRARTRRARRSRRKRGITRRRRRRSGSGSTRM